jgi:hypothetical protein
MLAVFPKFLSAMAALKKHLPILPNPFIAILAITDANKHSVL